MASGLSMPVGFKNRTDGNVQVALDAMVAARSSHSFLGIDNDGRIATVRTAGNPLGHLILRGSRGGPNYDPASIAAATEKMTETGLTPAIMVDCSHGNAGKRHEMEETVWNEVLQQRRKGSKSIIGMLVESNLEAGSQPFTSDLSRLHYGVSVTDACVDWPTTERMLRSATQIK
jgi:3-deoxy-7-phosphoheptulonate synthase